MKTLLIILDALIKTGYSPAQAEHIIAKFLEEESELYLECVKEQTILH